MTKTHQFIQAIREAGFSVTTDGEKLWISPRKRLTTCDKEFILAHRVELITALEAENAARFIRQRLAGSTTRGLPQASHLGLVGRSRFLADVGIG